MATKNKASSAVSTLKPRNPYVAAGLMRRAGVHAKSRKVLRQQNRQRMQRVLGDLLNENTTEYDIV